MSRYENTREIYGEFIVINEPQFVNHDFGFQAIVLTSSIMSEEEFSERFTYAKKENPFGKGFIRVRHKSPVLEEPAFPIVRRNPVTPRRKIYQRR